MIQRICKLIINVIVAAIMVFAPLLAVIFFYEYYEVGIKNEIAQYPFGNEEAISIGGKHYETAQKYAQQTLIEGTVFSLITLLIYLAVFKKNKTKYVIAAGVLFMGNIFYNLLF